MTKVLALMGAIAATIAGAIWLGHGHIRVLINPNTVILTVFGLTFLLLYAYGYQDIKRYLLGGYVRMLNPEKAPVWYDTDHAKAARIANTGILFSMLTGALGTLIGAVQMLQALEDPSAIGPALSVALLSLLYAVLVSCLGFMPLARFHASEARALSAKDQDETMLHSAWVFLLASFAMLGSFSILIVIFTGVEG